VIGEIFFGRMFGFLNKREDHGDYIASLDACMPVLCISAIGPRYLRPLIMACSILIPAVSKAVKAIDGIYKAAIVATDKRSKVPSGERQNDMLGQLLDIANMKGNMKNFSNSEVTLEAHTAM
jgi:hypothetical protein